MKTVSKNNKLAFNSTAVIELNDTQMYDVDGGITPTVAAAAAASSAGCAAIGGAIVGGIVAAIWA